MKVTVTDATPIIIKEFLFDITVADCIEKIDFLNIAVDDFTYYLGISLAV